MTKINRDTAHALQTLDHIFDKQKVEERQELARLFAKNADELLHYYDRDGKFDKAMAHGLVAEITSQIAGNKAGSGFAAGMTNELLMNKIKEWAGNDPAKAQWISAALGATVNAAVGKNIQTGGATAQYETKWNAYTFRPWYRGAFIQDSEGHVWVRTDTDEPYYGEVPIGAHIWVQDPSNPQYGWDYIREQNTYSYFPHIITNEYSFEFGGKLYGVRIYEYTNGYKVAQIQELGKRFAEAALLARVSTKNLDVILTGVKLIENPTYDNAVDFIKDIFLKNIL